MKEKLATHRNLEFCKDEQEAFEFRVMSVAAAKMRGGDVEAALKEMELTKEEYNNTLAAVFGLSKQEDDNRTHPFYLAR
jgi:hypothetical protein